MKNTSQGTYILIPDWLLLTIIIIENENWRTQGFHFPNARRFQKTNPPLLTQKVQHNLIRLARTVM
jgi:hypothetical protein